MMAIPIKTRLDPDGALNLHVPIGLPEADVEVVVVIQPVPPRVEAWPSNFFDETYGAFADSPIERGSQGKFSEREVLR
ncbi:MAG: hypothetical protein JO182_03880 [Acidobacteriaceae bacterium]|nr:hypothetical protein [Acidobacteriaceae bacterium]MBV9033613.1 hypothetical protein [Acidobacteriaceae bacterium]MBV9224943.1 hypothetical protein [Acidobacteriaceae bacterium]MBV9305060.1 hypothetical protein [Acidobacteriaceae bacterium]MBV9677903.1 hypothetical protein [Acidobacteriaceae bacterium]